MTLAENNATIEVRRKESRSPGNSEVDRPAGELQTKKLANLEIAAYESLGMP